METCASFFYANVSWLQFTFNVWRALREKFYQEQEAFTALQKGNERGLDFFFNRYYTPLIFFSTSITNNKSASQEIASEAFVKLWRNKETLTEYKDVKYLLYRIVRNASIDYLREQKRVRQHSNGLRYISESLEHPVLAKLIETETNHHLYLLLANLPPRCRQIFQMFYFQDKGIKEIAQELGVSVNTVKTQKQRAMQMLREKQASLTLQIFLLIFLFF